MLREFDKKIILESGQEFYGYSFGASRDKLLEIVFNTSMVGYQEILSDPSYTDQAVVMTYPLIGNYGMAREDYETQTPSIGALIVHDYNDEPSNFRSEASLSEIMEKYGITGIAGIDTRRLTRLIRDHGTGKALITDAAVRLSEGMEILQSAAFRKTRYPVSAEQSERCMGSKTPPSMWWSSTAALKKASCNHW